MLSSPEITSNVVSALHRDPRIKRPELIAVSVDEIGTVVLRGAVESPRQRVAAVHDARQVEGVFTVIDHLKVHLPIAGREADDAIRAAALKRLIADDGVRSDHIHVQVCDGWLTLTGHVREDSQRVRAEEDLAGITGVTGVTNRIELV
jgi:osmotically-inducible protein OsmY